MKDGCGDTEEEMEDAVESDGVYLYGTLHGEVCGFAHGSLALVEGSPSGGRRLLMTETDDGDG